MKAQLLKVVLLVGIFSIVVPMLLKSPADCRLSVSKAHAFLSFKNRSGRMAGGSILSERFKKKVDFAVRPALTYIKDSPLGERYRREPVLFGFLTLFSGVFLGVLFVLIRMVRSDPRFY